MIAFHHLNPTTRLSRISSARISSSRFISTSSRLLTPSHTSDSSPLKNSLTSEKNPYGYFPPPRIGIEDYPPSHLQNRNASAPLLRYVDNVRRHGHRAANIDPLGLMEREEEVKALDPRRYGLGDDESHDISGILEFPKEVMTKDGDGMKMKTRDITSHLKKVYVDRMGIEFMHCGSKAVRNWFMSLLETQSSSSLPTDQQKIRIWELLARSESLDRFLQAKLGNVKRYGLEGAESMLPCIDRLFERASEDGIESVLLCLPHRGRLSLLTELLEYPLESLINKMKGRAEIPELFGATGDVLSHLAASPTLSYGDSKIKVELLQNPSHLEAVDSLCMGKARGKQTFQSYSSDSSAVSMGSKVLPLQIHGDAAFTGQGVVMETLGLSELPHYAVGGSIHLIINNSIGYTTLASEGRSSLYASDLAKMIDAPVIHVNGNHPESAVKAVEVALKYRQKFKRDVVIDLLVQRKYGHNELDEPRFTQPLMYEKILKNGSLPEAYEKTLIGNKVLTKEKAEEFRSRRNKDFEAALIRSETFEPIADHLGGKWGRAGMVWPADEKANHNPDTGLEKKVLRKVGLQSVEVPKGFNLHSRLNRHIKQRIESLESGKGINWATAEALAWGSLLEEGQHVRISGQDVGRGTFSHRHAVLVDQQTEQSIVPLNNTSASTSNSITRGTFEAASSSLSELAVLGFEVGLSWERPDLLPIWEAQFGDFGNGAQIAIDTFVSCSEAKWLKQSALTMILPHGYDGAGPEHSSGRIERYLSLCNDPFEVEIWNPNMGVVNPSTPAQYYHVLRRQMKRNYRKPLIVFSPKGLLRSPLATSTLDDMSSGAQFQPVLPCSTTSSAPSSVSKVILCSGKHFYTLQSERNALKLDSKVALIRVEELSPFPFEKLSETLRPYVEEGKEGLEMVWSQEEPRNQGAYPHVMPRLENVLLNELGWKDRVKYVGRKESGVTATGVGEWYKREAEELRRKAFEGL